MRLGIETVIGHFHVFTMYLPSPDDKLLSNLTRTINDACIPFIEKGNSILVVPSLLDEAALEKKLFDSTRVANGSAPRITLSLRDRIIKIDNF